MTCSGKSVKNRYIQLHITGNEIMKVGYKIWLDNGGKAFGEGPYELLKRVEKTDSLHEAAHQMNMSYSKAWKVIQTMEKRLGFTFLDKKVGGLAGGGSRVTPEGKEFLRRYERFDSDAKKVIERTYQKHFGNQLTEKGGR